MGETAIEWADACWEPVSGCTPVSEGCKRCWARRLAEGRLRRFYPDGFGTVRLHLERLLQPMSWRKPRRVFVCSRSDLFHPEISLDDVERIWTTMATESCRRHSFLLLTKRPERMMEFFQRPRMYIGEPPNVLPNLWLGVSVENQKAADERISLLLATPAAVRFISAEPLLAPLDLDSWFGWMNDPIQDRAGFTFPRVHWVIVGCESGPGARPMAEGWVRSLRDQCQAAGVAFYLKQMMVGGKKMSLPELDGRRWTEIPT